MKSININAPVKHSKQIIINAPAENVWAIMTDINNWPTWQTEISKTKLNGELKPGTTFEWKTGGAKILSTLHTVNPHKQFGWTGKTLGMLAIHNWSVTANASNTVVSVDESMEGFLARLFKSSFNKNLKKDMQHWLELLKARCE